MHCTPSGKAEIAREADGSTGIKHDVLTALQKRLKHLPRRSETVKPATQIGPKAFEVVIGIFFTLAAAAYWIFERDKTVDVLLLADPETEAEAGRRRLDADRPAPGAFVRGQALLIIAVGIVLSPFWAIGFMDPGRLVGRVAGRDHPRDRAARRRHSRRCGRLDRVVPGGAPGGGVVGLGVRLLEDYLIMPRCSARLSGSHRCSCSYR